MNAKSAPDGNTQPFVTVIIPAYNDRERLVRCLECLENQTYPSDRYEVLVVDNASDEPIVQLVEPFVRARALFEAKQGSYAARNTGIEQACGEVVAFTDSDCLPQSDWLEAGVRLLTQREGIGLVAGRIEVFCKDPRRPTGAELYDSVLGFPQQRFVEESGFGATANVFTFKQVIDRVGPFNRQVKSGGDSEWGWRVGAGGFAVIYGDDVVVRHPARETVAELTRKSRRVQKGIKDLNISTGSVSGFLTKLSAVMSAPQARGPVRRVRVLAVFLWLKFLQEWYKLVIRIGRT